MKMTKVALSFSIFASAFFLLDCKPKKANVEPVADTETQTAVDAVWATYVITDIDQICAFIGEDEFFNTFYANIPPPQGTGTIQIVRDLAASQKVLGWAPDTKCLDGRLRDGSVFLYYYHNQLNPLANPNSRYYRDFGFAGRIQLSNYKVDGWLIRCEDVTIPYGYVVNKLTTDAYDQKTTPLTWEIRGRFTLNHPSDPSKNIFWDGVIYKTLTNSTDKDIFPLGKQTAINWMKPDPNPAKSKAGICSYYGKVTGYTAGKVPFTLEIAPENPLIRDFMCSADPVSYVVPDTGTTAATSSVTIYKEEHHPFIKGIASFTTGVKGEEKYPRQIYFGNEGSPDLLPQCDNTGEVLIKGNSYKVNFRK